MDWAARPGVLVKSTDQVRTFCMRAVRQSACAVCTKARGAVPQLCVQGFKPDPHMLVNCTRGPNECVRFFGWG